MQEETALREAEEQARREEEQREQARREEEEREQARLKEKEREQARREEEEREQARLKEEEREQARREEEEREQMDEHPKKEEEEEEEDKKRKAEQRREDETLGEEEQQARRRQKLRTQASVDDDDDDDDDDDNDNESVKRPRARARSTDSDDSVDGGIPTTPFEGLRAINRSPTMPVVVEEGGGETKSVVVEEEVEDEIQRTRLADNNGQNVGEVMEQAKEEKRQAKKEAQQQQQQQRHQQHHHHQPNHPDLESDADYTALITEIYRQHKPEKLQDSDFVPSTLRKYAGKEKQLLAALRKQFKIFDQQQLERTERVDAAEEEGHTMLLTGAAVAEEEGHTMLLTGAAVAEEERVQAAERSPRLHTGDRIEVDYKRTGKFFVGAVAERSADGTYEVLYDDGDHEAGVERNQISSLMARAAIEYKEGDAVEVNYKGAGSYFKGKVSFVNSDGTYDVRYDDGDMESGAKAERLRPLLQAPRAGAEKNGEHQAEAEAEMETEGRMRAPIVATILRRAAILQRGGDGNRGTVSAAGQTTPKYDGNTNADSGLGSESDGSYYTSSEYMTDDDDP
jgi:hypothetical protein